jgi:hypothetical protein
MRPQLREPKRDTTLGGIASDSSRAHALDYVSVQPRGSANVRRDPAEDEQKAEHENERNPPAIISHGAA